MAKKSKKKATRPSSKAPAVKDISVSKQVVGGVTGAVLGAMVGGPVVAIAGGVVGAIVGEQSAQGKRPVARTAETLGEEIRKGTPMKALKSVASATKPLGRSRKTSPKSSMSSTSKPRGRKTAKTDTRKKAVKKSKAKTAKHDVKAKKGAKKKTPKKR